jgi:hypothetical protein
LTHVTWKNIGVVDASIHEVGRLVPYSIKLDKKNNIEIIGWYWVFVAIKDKIKDIKNEYLSNIDKIYIHDARCFQIHLTIPSIIS